MKNYKDLLRLYFGSGNSKNSIWFVGMEWTGIGENILINLDKISKDKLIDELNGEACYECLNINKFFGIAGLITKELGFNDDIVKKDGKEYISFKKNGNLFWTNTSLLGFPNSWNSDKHKINLDEYRKYLNDLNELNYYNLFFNSEFLNIREKNFSKSLNDNPKFIFVSGNGINKKRFFTLINDFSLKPFERLEISYNTGKGKMSIIDFYEKGNLKFAICPFFCGRWYEVKKDVNNICKIVKNYL